MYESDKLFFHTNVLLQKEGYVLVRYIVFATCVLYSSSFWYINKYQLSNTNCR